MKKKNIIIPVIMVLILGIVLTRSFSKYNNAPAEPVRGLVSILYFNSGSYNDYKMLFTEPAYAFNEEQFSNFRKNPNKSSFNYGSSSVNEISKHLKVQREKDSAIIYYLKDVNNKEEIETCKLKWNVQKVNGKWFLKNN